MWIDRRGDGAGPHVRRQRALPLLQRRRRRQRRPAGHHEGVPARRQRGGRQPEPEPDQRAGGAGVRRPPRAPGDDGRAERRGLPDPADHRRRRRAAAARDAGRALSEPARVQPLARGGLGLRRRRPHLRRAAAVAVRSRRKRVAELERLLAARRALRHPHRRAGRRTLAGRSVLRSVLGALRGGRARTSSTTSAARPSARCTTRRGACARTRRRTATR